MTSVAEGAESADEMERAPVRVMDGGVYCVACGTHGKALTGRGEPMRVCAVCLANYCHARAE